METVRSSKHFNLFDTTSIELVIECSHTILHQRISAATQGLGLGLVHTVPVLAKLLTAVTSRFATLTT